MMLNDVMQLMLLFVLTIAAVYDALFERIPDWLTFPATIIFSLVQFGFSGAESIWIFTNWLLPTLAFLLIHAVSKGGVGMGDVKLVGILGISLGWLHAFMVLVVMNGLAMIYGIVMKTLRRPLIGLPLGPFFLAGALLTKFSLAL